MLDEVHPHCRRQVDDGPSCIGVVCPVLLEVEDFVDTQVVPDGDIPGWIGVEGLVVPSPGCDRRVVRAVEGDSVAEAIREDAVLGVEVATRLLMRQ